MAFEQGAVGIPERRSAWRGGAVGGAWLLVPGLLALAYLILFLPYAAGYGDFRVSLARWLRIQWAQPTWQHGALAPLIAGLLVWRRRAELASLRLDPRWSGLVLVVLGFLVYWIGYRGNFYFLGYASLQVLAGAVVLWLWGWEHFKRVAFAWFILAFAWPYVFLEDTLAFQLRRQMVGLTSWLLNHAGVPTHQDGTALVSAAAEGRARGEWFSLTVDGPCSGMRSLFALMMVAALYGYFRQRSWWRRAILFALGIPLAVLANMARILILVVASVFLGQDFAVGRGEDYTSNFHLLTGVAVFLVSLSGLAAAEALLNRCCGREPALRLLPS